MLHFFVLELDFLRLKVETDVDNVIGFDTCTRLGAPSRDNDDCLLDKAVDVGGLLRVTAANGI